MRPRRGLRARLLLRLALWRAGTRLAVAVVISAAVAMLLPAALPGPLRAVAAWDAFALPALVLTWLTILTLEPARIRHLARREDPGRVVALVLAVGGAGVALLAVGALLAAKQEMKIRHEHLALALALPAVAMAWALTHTVFTLRYAHVYYGDPGAPGLRFPVPDAAAAYELDYLDFAYFAFTIGMAVQTADIVVCSRPMRRLTLSHALISFFFNTAVITLIISEISAFL